MLELIAQIIGSILLLSGVVFCFLGGLGALSFPDFYTRIHATSLTDSFGAILVLVGLMFFTHFDMVTIKLGFVVIFIIITGPVAANSLVNAAWFAGLKPWTRKNMENKK